MNQFFEDDDESDDDALILSLIAIDEEEERRKERRRGSVHGREVVYRDIHGGNLRLVADYFAHVPVYNDKFFMRRFRTSRNLFLRIVEGVEAHDDYFRQRPNVAGLLGATALQKVVGAIRMLAYDVPVDSMDEVSMPEDYRRDPLVLSDFLHIHKEIKDRTIHEQLRDDLMEHLWARHGAL